MLPGISFFFFIVSSVVVDCLLAAYVPRLTPGSVAASSQMVERQVCMTESCKRIAKHFRSSMDIEADPCADFYEYACGLWKQLNIPSEESSAFSTLSAISDTDLQLLKEAIEDMDPDVETERSMVLLKQIYDVCMDESAANEAGPQPLIELMDKALGHHMSPMDLILQQYVPSDNVPLETRVAELWLDLGISSLVSIYINQDEKNSSRHMLYLGAPWFELGPQGHDWYLSNDTENDEYLASYFEAMQAFNRIWKYGSLSHELNGAEILALKKLLKFEQRLAVASLVNGSQEEYQYNLVNFTTLDGMSSRFSLTLLAKEFPPVNEVIVFNPNFFSNIDGVLEDTPNEVIHAYLAWIMLIDQFKYLGSEYLKLYYEYFGDHVENCQTCGRPYDCLDYLIGDMDELPNLGMAIGKLFITTSGFDEESVTLVSEMANELRTAFRQMVKDNMWMDSATKQKTYEKIGATQSVIGHPALLSGSLDEYYLPLLEDQQDLHGMVIDCGDSFLEVNHKLTMWTFRGAAKRLLESPSSLVSDASPALTNAWYLYSKNAIYIPAGIIQFPIFDKDAPAAVNFGALGFVIGHELTHGLDNLGSKVDINGNLNDWWSENSTEKFKEKVKCISDQYSEYCYVINDEEICVDGERTVGENIADNGGLRESFIAYKNFAKNRQEMVLPSFQDFTTEKIFFLSYGNLYCASMTDEYLADMIASSDPHSPRRDRVNGALRNFEEFSKAFNCPLGSAMNPTEKCIVW